MTTVRGTLLRVRISRMIAKPRSRWSFTVALTAYSICCMGAKVQGSEAAGFAQSGFLQRSVE